MKNGLGKYRPPTLTSSPPIIKSRLRRIQYRPALIEAFLAQADLTSNPSPRKELKMLAISTSVTDRLFYGQLKRNRQRERRPAAESAVVLGPLLVRQGARA